MWHISTQLILAGALKIQTSGKSLPAEVIQEGFPEEVGFELDLVGWREFK